MRSEPPKAALTQLFIIKKGCIMCVIVEKVDFRHAVRISEIGHTNDSHISAQYPSSFRL
jgi:hypothetical protein